MFAEDIKYFRVNPVIVLNHGNSDNPCIYHFALFVADVSEFYTSCAPRKVYRMRLADGKLWDVFKDNLQLI